jgi:hypothetical protein
MTITVFTGNQPRHTALIEALAQIADTVNAVQECTTVFPGRVPDFFQKSEVMQRYFQRVMKAERERFGTPRFPRSSGNIQQFAIRMGDLSSLDLESLGPALDADWFIVFGASYIKGPLCEALIERRAVNIHMGVSPYYRGSSTNFWALYDRRPEFVGATIHRLTTGLDSGPILFHALPPPEPIDPFALGMSAVASAHEALAEALVDGRLRTLNPVPQDRSREIRYTRNADFTDAAAEQYLRQIMSAKQVGAILAARGDEAYIRPVIGRLTPVGCS